MPGPVGGGRHGGGGGSFGGGARGGGFSGGGFSGGHRPAGGFHRHGGHRHTGGSSGCSAPFIIVFAVVVIFIISVGGTVFSGIGSLFSFFDRTPNVVITDSYYDDWAVEEAYSLHPMTVTPNETQRTKLDASLCTPIDTWFEDGADLLTYASEEMEVEQALSYFYEKTGVQPYLMMLDHIDHNYYPDWSAVENHLYDRYVELFGEDEGHYIFLYFAYEDGTYDLFYIPGWDAMDVMDDNASTILLDYVELYYTTSLSYAEMFSEAFISTANTIMGETEQDTSVVLTDPQTGNAVVSTAPPASTTAVVADESEEYSVTVTVYDDETTEFSAQPESTSEVIVSQEPDPDGANIAGVITYEDEETAKTFGDMSVKEIAWVSFGAVAVIVLFVLVLRRRKKQMEDLEKMM